MRCLFRQEDTFGRPVIPVSESLRSHSGSRLTTIESGKMTGDLILISDLENKEKLSTLGFITAVRETLDTLM